MKTYIPPTIEEINIEKDISLVMMSNFLEVESEAMPDRATAPKMSVR